MLKRVAIMLFCLMMVFIATFGFVLGVVAVPTIYSYAAVNDDPIYVPLRDPSDAVTAFQYYCKSRDLTIEGSLTDAVTTFTTGAFNSACNEIGINISELQAELKAEYDQSGKPVKFLLNDTGVMAMNRIFAQFLQDNELQVGDTDVNKTVYSGRYFVDADGNGCLVYINPNINSNDELTSSYNCSFEAIGSDYRFSASDLINYVGNSSYNINFNLTQNLSFSQTLTYYTYQNSSYKLNAITNGSAYNSGFKFYEDTLKKSDNSTYNTVANGRYIISQRNGILYLSEIANNSQNLYIDATTSTPLYYRELQKIVNPQAQSSTVIIISTEINNNFYEGDTIINNEGDIITEPVPVPPGGSDPGWDIGGGDGTATDGDGNTWNIQFPNFELPDLNIDWSINGLGEKFPFSIPFDLVSLVTVLNAEPQAPRFEGTVNFGFTTWNYDINLQQFDSVAQACRIAELLLLVVGLILVTRSIIKG